jgi:hypothetical protein
MTAPTREQVAAFLTQHRLKQPTGQCGCGQQLEALVGAGMVTEHAEHLADVLTPWLAERWPRGVVERDDYGG